MGWQDRGYNQGDSGSSRIQIQFPPMTPMVIVLLAVNLAFFLLKIFETPYIFALDWGGLRFSTYGEFAQVWRWVTYQYLHGDGGHIFFNMLSMYFFLPTLEQRWGWKRALGFYTLGGIAAGLVYLLMVTITGQWGVYLIGASGSVLATIGAVAYLYPEIRLFMIIPIRVFAALLAILYVLTTVGDRNFSDAAHLGGLAFGFLAPWVAGPFLLRQQQNFKQWNKDRAQQAEVDEQQEVDRILAKVAERGMHSLRGAEKRALSRATENQRKRDAEREKRRSIR